ncbi:MAG: hypothetical protein IKH26_02425 [Bacteroidaceae bacterium]|nr:hypothetical protein [Bacteroidaceae bacterium]
MKKFMITLMVMMTMVVTSAKGMSYELAREEAAFIADKMAYELDLSEMQYESVYEVYFDYFLNITPTNIYGIYWDHLCTDLTYILTPGQYRRFKNIAYFYRPVVYRSGNLWSFPIYNLYVRDYYYFNRPQAYVVYRSAHSRANNHHTSYYKGINYSRPAGGGMRTVKTGRRNDYAPVGGHAGGHPNGKSNDVRKPSHPNGATHVQNTPNNGAGRNNARIQHGNNTTSRPSNSNVSNTSRVRTSAGATNDNTKPTAARGGRH